MRFRAFTNPTFDGAKSRALAPSLRMESLETRNLMAADLGMIDLGPAAPSSGDVVATALAAPAATAFDVPIAFESNGTVVIKGTDDPNFRDHVIVTQQGDDMHLSLKKLDLAGNTVFQTVRVFSGGEGFNTSISFEGFRGNDTFINGTSYTSVARGGDGNDVLIGGGSVDVLYGDAGHDFISDAAGINFLYGGSGNDEILGGAGVDYIYGEQGADSIQGGAGDDFLYGGTENDVIQGNAGNDFISGGDGSDQLIGDDNRFNNIGGGADVISGGRGNDLLMGQSGNDQLLGDDGDDHIVGGVGHDNLQGGNGRDTLLGGLGNDRLDGGYDGAKDRLFGEAGADTFIFHRSFLGQIDVDTFFDLNSSEGDRRETDWHW